ncbi:hypothetical protein GLOIN_2v1677695, partial [Rhizophagus irregularis DAOM 181602=DAOM 197198]
MLFLSSYIKFIDYCHYNHIKYLSSIYFVIVFQISPKKNLVFIRMIWFEIISHYN